MFSAIEVKPLIYMTFKADLIFFLTY